LEEYESFLLEYAAPYIETSFCYIKPKRIGANEGSNTLTTTTGSREQPSTLKESDY
jgi:hypothetical protein